MPYKHNQLKGIKKSFQNYTKVICSSNLAIIWRLLVSRQSFKSRIQERILKNKISNNIK